MTLTLTRKVAQLGGEQDGSFEQAFASLAYSHLQDKAPRLVDHIVGFQLVERNEDSTKAVGVFGVKLNSLWIYAPVFFLNGKLKGHELLYVKSKDLFLPMKEGWINYLMSRQTNTEGEPSLPARLLGSKTPDFSRISNPPTYAKYGGHGHVPADFRDMVVQGIRRPADAMPPWAKQAMTVFAAAAQRDASFLFEQAQPGQRLGLDKLASAPLTAALTGTGIDLPAFLSEHPQLATAALHAYTKYAFVRRGIDKFYGGLPFFRQLGQTMAKRANASRSVSLLDREHSELGLKPYHPSQQVTVYTKQAAFARHLSDADRRTVLDRGLLIRDNRAASEKSAAYSTQQPVALANPDCSGIHSVLEKPGTFSDLLVLMGPVSTHGPATGRVLVVRLSDSDDKAYGDYKTGDIWVRQRDETNKPGKVSNWFDRVPGHTGKLEERAKYIAVGPNGQSTVPFRVDTAHDTGVYTVHLDYVDCFSNVSWDSPTRLYDVTLRVDERSGTRLRNGHTELHVPSNFKFVKLESPSPSPRSGMAVEPAVVRPAPKPIQPGASSDIQLLLYKKAQQMKLYGDASEVVIATKQGQARHSWLNGLISLVRDHGLDEKTASDMLRQAQVRPATFFIKYAMAYPQHPGPGAPQFPEPNYGTEPIGYGSVNAIYPQEEHIRAEGLLTDSTDPAVYDPFKDVQDAAMQLAQYGEQSGNKEVFDVGMLAGMIKSVRKDSLVDRHLGSLMRSIDSLGRILFLFYWHQEDFEDRYGKHDLPELEDAVRNAFEAVGDVVLFLKEKTIESPAMGLDLDDVAGN